jgi:hypothetical protein
MSAVPLRDTYVHRPKSSIRLDRTEHGDVNQYRNTAATTIHGRTKLDGRNYEYTADRGREGASIR